MKIVTEVNRLYEANGHRKMRFWGGVTGRANFFVDESECESLAAWEAENHAVSRDADIMELLRQTVDLMDTTEIHELLVSRCVQPVGISPAPAARPGRSIPRDALSTRPRGNVP